MKGLFQCPPWAKSFCPFRAFGEEFMIDSPRAPGGLYSEKSFDSLITSAGTSLQRS